MLADKTGVLIATAAPLRRDVQRRVAGDRRRRCAGYGEQLGVAFQLADDLIDIASETGQSGKTPGTDLREGVPTLPVLLALRSDDPADARLHELLRADLRHDDALHAEALGLLRRHDAMRLAREHTRQVGAEAGGAARAAAAERGQGGAARASVEGVVDRVG